MHFLKINNHISANYCSLSCLSFIFQAHIRARLNVEMVKIEKMFLQLWDEEPFSHFNSKDSFFKHWFSSWKKDYWGCRTDLNVLWRRILQNPKLLTNSSSTFSAICIYFLCFDVDELTENMTPCFLHLIVWSIRRRRAACGLDVCLLVCILVLWHQRVWETFPPLGAGAFQKMLLETTFDKLCAASCTRSWGWTS